MPKTKTQKKPQLIRKDQVTGETSWKDDSSQNWFTWWAALSAGMVFMGGRRTGGYSLEDYCGTSLQLSTFSTLKCTKFQLPSVSSKGALNAMIGQHREPANHFLKFSLAIQNFIHYPAWSERAILSHLSKAHLNKAPLVFHQKLVEFLVVE